eukprot:tig00020610_g12079.t1
MGAACAVGARVHVEDPNGGKAAVSGFKEKKLEEAPSASSSQRPPRPPSAVVTSRSKPAEGRLIVLEGPGDASNLAIRDRGQTPPTAPATGLDGSAPAKSGSRPSSRAGSANSSPHTSPARSSPVPGAEAKEPRAAFPLDRTLRVYFSSSHAEFQRERVELRRFLYPKLQRLAAARGLYFAPCDLRLGVSEQELESGALLEAALSEVERAQYFVCLLGDGSLPRPDDEEEGPDGPDAPSAGPSSSSASSAPLRRTSSGGGLGGNARVALPPLRGSGAAAVAMEAAAAAVETEEAEVFGAASREEAAARFPAIAKFADRAVTDIEARFAALMPKARPGLKRSFFYLRRSGGGGGGRGATPPAASGLQGASAARQLAALKREVGESGAACREFGSIGELGGAVLRDLEAALERDYPPAAAPRTWLEVERLRHEAFAKARRKILVGGDAVLRSLDAYADSKSSTPLLVTGEPGSGKSALLAAWAARRRQSPGAAGEVLHVHYAGGGGSEDASLSAILRRAAAEIAAAVGSPSLPAEPEPVPSDEDVVVGFAGFLQRAAALLAAAGAPRLILAIDGLDEVQDGTGVAGGLSWMPPKAPRNVRVVFTASSSAGPASAALVERAGELGWRRLEIAPLEPAETARVALAHMGPLAARADRAALDAAVAAAPEMTPLCARLLAEAMRSPARDAGASMGAEALKGGAPRLYALAIARWRAEFTPALVQRLLGYLLVTREGLTEGDLQALLALSAAPSRWAALRLALGPALAQRAGCLCLADRQLAEAARAECGLEEGSLGLRKAHEELAAHFLAQPPSERRATEGAYHAHRAGMHERVVRLLAEPAALSALHAPRHRWAAVAYLSAAAAHGCDVPELLEAALGGAVHAGEVEAAQAGDALAQAGALLAAAGGQMQKGALSLLFLAVTLKRKVLGSLHSDVAQTMATTAACHVAQREHDRALAVLEKARDALRAGVAEGAGLAAASMADEVAHWQAVAHTERGEFDKASAVLEAAAAEQLGRLGVGHPTVARTAQATVSLLLARGDAAGALAAIAARLKALGLGEEGGAEGPWLHEKTVAAHLAAGDSEAALAAAHKALALVKRSHGARHLAVGDLLTALARACHARGDTAGVLSALQERAHVLEAACGKESLRVAQCLHDMAGVVAADLQDLDRAMKLAKRAQRICKGALSKDHPRVASANFLVAALHRGRGDPARSLTTHLMALRARQRSLGEQHEETASSLGAVAELQRQLGRHAEALRSYRQQLAALRALRGPASLPVARCLLALAETHLEAGDSAAFIKHAEEAAEAARQCGGPGGEPILRALLEAYEAVGNDAGASALRAELGEDGSAAPGPRADSSAASASGAGGGAGSSSRASSASRAAAPATSPSPAPAPVEVSS